jgi:hypothetical protein
VDSAGNVYVTDASNFTLRLGYVVTGANSAFLLVPATSDPYLAGMPPGSTASTDDRAPAQSPVQVTNLPITPGLILNFQVVGDTSHGGGFPLLDAEGGGIYHHAAGSENGVADVFMPIDALLGVFLDNSAPNRSAAPSGLNFTSAGSRSYPSLRPALKQPFFIGNGLTTNGIVKSVIVPPGATRLFLGIMDGFQWAGNFGMLRVAVATNEATTPAILVQPVSVSALPGTDVGFSVVASGAPPLAYYWHFDGASLPGATGPSLDFSNVQATNAGFYQVVVTNAFGSVTSSTVTLGVLGAPARFIGGPSGLFLRTDGFHLLLGGLTGQGSLVLETSTDLARWFPIFTNPPAFGTIEFVDPAASNVSSRYYRVRVGAP